MVSRWLVYSVLWVLATMLGYLFAGSGTHFPGSFPVGSGLVSAFDTNAALYGALIGGVGGAVIGTSQWLVLRSWIGMSSGWIWSTVLAVSITHALGDGLPSSWEWPPLAIAGGSILVGAQWVALAHRRDRPLLSITSGIAFALAVIVGVGIADPRSGDWRTAHLVAAGIAGALFAAGVGTVVLTLRSARQTPAT